MRLADDLVVPERQDNPGPTQNPLDHLGLSWDTFTFFFTEVWTSIICLQFNCISLPCLLRNATHVTDLSKLYSIPSFPLIIIYHFPELIRMKDCIKDFELPWRLHLFSLLLRLLFGIFLLLFPPQATSYVWPLNNPFSPKCSPPFTLNCKNKFGGT